MAAKVNNKSVGAYTDIRAGMVSRGISLRKWAKRKGHKYTTVVSAAKRERAGPKSELISQQLEAFLNERPS